MGSKKPVMSHDPLEALGDVDSAPAAPDTENAGGITDDASPSTVDAAGEASTVTAGGPLVLPSSLTIADVGEIYPVLTERLTQGGDIGVDGSAVEAIDGEDAGALDAGRRHRDRGIALDPEEGVAGLLVGPNAARAHVYAGNGSGSSQAPASAGR